MCALSYTHTQIVLQYWVDKYKLFGQDQDIEGLDLFPEVVLMPEFVS